MADDDRISRKVATSRAAQGLPPAIEDPATLERVAAIFRLVADQAAEAESSKSSPPRKRRGRTRRGPPG